MFPKFFQAGIKTWQERTFQKLLDRLLDDSDVSDLSIRQLFDGPIIKSEQKFGTSELDKKWSPTQAVAQPARIQQAAAGTGRQLEVSEAVQNIPPNTLELRCLASCYLAGRYGEDGLPLYTCGELADWIKSLRRFLGEERDNLITTGLPKHRFVDSTWLEWRLSRLYPVKCTRNMFPFEEPIEFKGEQSYHQWVRRQKDVDGKIEYVPCHYEDADFIGGLGEEDAKRLTELRTKIFNLKIEVLRQIELALPLGQDGRLLDRAFSILQAGANGNADDGLTGEEADFLVRMDGIYGRHLDGHYHRERAAKYTLAFGKGPEPGGFTDIVALIGHALKEFQIGTMDKTRTELEGMLNTSTQGILALDADGAWPYLEFLGTGNQEQVERVLDSFLKLDSREPQFWNSFSESVTSRIEEDFLEKVPIPRSMAKHLRGRDGSLASMFAIWKESLGSPSQMIGGRIEGGPHYEIGIIDENVFQRLGDDWNIRYDGGPLFALPYLVGLEYIHHLIENPGQSFSGQDLKAIRVIHERDNTSRSLAGAEQAAADGSGELSHSDHSGEAIDKMGMEQINARLQYIDEQLSNPKHLHDEAKTAKLEEEKEELIKYLKSNTNIYGKATRLQDERGKDKKAVTKTIKEAIERISTKDSNLSQHLSNSIICNGFRYQPSLKISWKTC